MKQVILNIPDAEFDFFMSLIQKFNYTATEAKDITIPEEVKKLVDQRRKSARKSDYITVAQSNQKLKRKYGF